MKTTLITGASGGIGETFARKLAERKHNLFLVARSADKLAALCNELKSKHNIEADFFAVDLTAHDAHERLYAATNKRGLQVEWLINNAGFGNFGEFSQNDLNKELAMIDLNVRTLVALTHRYLQPMRERRSGTIINVSSTAGFQPLPYLATYGATKSFVTSFSEAIWAENREHNIRVLALCPGGTDTNFFNRAGVGEGRLPMRGLESPEVVVETALRAVETGKSTIVSGWGNYFGAVAGKLAPGSLVARLVGNALRSRARTK